MVTAVLDAIGDAILAEDVVSEVFLTVWRHADGFKARAQVSTRLLAIARNKSLSVVKCRSDRHVDCEEMKIEDPADDPEVLLDKSERRDAIREWRVIGADNE
jgi:RNA polymerase sigma-70 factor, ECF subfamily